MTVLFDLMFEWKYFWKEIYFYKEFEMFRNNVYYSEEEF